MDLRATVLVVVTAVVGKFARMKAVSVLLEELLSFVMVQMADTSRDALAMAFPARVSILAAIHSTAS